MIWCALVTTYTCTHAHIAAKYSYMKIFIYTGIVQNLSYKRVFKNFDYKNYPNYGTYNTHLHKHTYISMHIHTWLLAG